MPQRLLALVPILLASLPAQGDIFFTGVGDLPGGATSSAVWALSGDGSTAVGHSHTTGTASGDYEAFRWTREGGMQPLGVLNTRWYESQASGVSYDGSVIVGRSASGSGSTGDPISTRPFRWTESTGIREIPNLPGGNSSGWGNGVSGDGNTVVGWMSSEVSAPDNGFAAFRWTQAGGTQELGDLPGGRYFSEARSASHDGGTIVGYSESTAGTQAMRWTAAEGMVGLGDLPGGNFRSEAQAVTPDGSVIVGGGTSANGFEAFRWENNILRGLGDLPGGNFSSWAFDVSADGLYIVGSSNVATTNGSRAFIWDEANGMRLLSDVLTAAGLDLTGWTLSSAYGISDDGLTFAGIGQNPEGRTEGWVAHIQPASVPEPNSLALLTLLAGATVVRHRVKRRRSAR